MKIKISAIWLIMFLVILGIVNAQNLCGTPDNPCKDNWDNFDYANMNSCVSCIPPDKVNIEKVIAEGRGYELTVEQIELNLDKISDLKYVDKVKAEEAIRKSTGYTVDIGNGATLKNGVLVATYGNKDSVPLSQVSKTTLVKIDENGNVLLIGEKKPPKEGSYTAIYPKTTSIETPDGKQISVDGKLSYRNGQAYVKWGDEVTINGLTIKSSFSNNAEIVYVHFDGKLHSQSEDYISFDNKNKNLIINMGKGFDLTFQKQNPFLKIEETDFFKIEHTQGVQFSIQNRDEQDLIPKVVIKKFKADTEIRFVNGNLAIIMDKNNQLRHNIIGKE